MNDKEFAEHNAETAKKAETTEFVNSEVKKIKVLVSKIATVFQSTSDRLEFLRVNFSSHDGTISCLDKIKKIFRRSLNNRLPLWEEKG